MNNALDGIRKSIDIKFNTNAADAISEINSVASALASVPTSIDVTITISVSGSIPDFSGLSGVTISANAMGGIIPHATGGIIPHATGSIINKPTLTNYKGQTHLFGEAGREAILPLDSYTGWMDQVADKVNDRINGDDSEGVSFEQALARFYQSYLEPVMTEISADTKRQADKDERPIVKIGQRDIKNAYDSQSKADGYRFTR